LPSGRQPQPYGAESKVFSSLLLLSFSLLKKYSTFFQKAQCPGGEKASAGAEKALYAISRFPFICTHSAAKETARFSL
jgi:hypothetical protein